jgi:wyosine [tRNA(Phe)-imidazoG37] synthetase (radical SAM superfamily)
MKVMKKLENREHDFSSKLRQKATIQRLKDYIQWQRDSGYEPSRGGLPSFSPISINLDLTSACNFSCPYCVDSRLINAGKSLTVEEVKKTIETLHSHGLRSVILIGGGEPTLHKDFEEIVRTLKSKGLQIGIVTNGSRLEKVEAIADQLEKKDWIRISVDAGQEGTFRELHQPKGEVTLHQILEKTKRVKEKNPAVSLGYSFVIIWEGVKINGHPLTPNIHEMAKAVELAREFSFDYVSFKPCLVRFEESQRETLLKNVGKRKETEIIREIERQLEKARETAENKVKILESSNLKAMLSQETKRIKRQPKRCHLQYFRTVVTPFGIYHCPAFRGIDIAKIGEKDGYLTEAEFEASLEKTARSIRAFKAERECKDVGCFYNDTNWWLENFIHSDQGIGTLENVEDDNFFL